MKINAHIYGGRKDVWKNIKNKQYLKRKILFTVFSFFSQAQQWKSLKLISAVYYHNSWIVNSAGECLFNNAIVTQFRRKFVKKLLLVLGDKFKHTILLHRSREQTRNLEGMLQ